MNEGSFCKRPIEIKCLNRKQSAPDDPLNLCFSNYLLPGFDFSVKYCFPLNPEAPENGK
uniref:Uncharacterized protein n=1 Tax=Nelumbo nucifera TaxID=4432 RepID=A0A822Y5R4_NELNU|nr:TPA_asm: hypothetical protein HUJ06_027853 [Nelumbo nucifera]